MGTKKKKDVEVKCDPVKELAKDVLCALVASNDTYGNHSEVVKEAYEYAEAFENYKRE